MSRDFQDVLTDIDEGRLHAQLTNQLAELVRACVATKKSGALTLTMNVKEEGNVMVVGGSVKLKLPQPAAGASVFYATEDGDLRRDNPRQPVLRNVHMSPTPIIKPAVIGGEE